MGSPSTFSTAKKAGKFGAILVLADVVTGFAVGKQVFGIFTDKEGADKDESKKDWNEKLADKILNDAQKNAEQKMQGRVKPKTSDELADSYIAEVKEEAKQFQRVEPELGFEIAPEVQR